MHHPGQFVAVPAGGEQAGRDVLRDAHQLGNGDGQVSFEDFSLLQNNYGQSGASAANPLAAATSGCGSLGILLLSVLGLMFSVFGWQYRK